MAQDGPDSNNSSYPYHSNKPQRQKCNSRSSKIFKGVVPQKNGRTWGAQIYTKQKRIWLGMFKSENEAAMAYDSVAIKLRSEYSQRNFLLNDLTIHEPNFQNLHSTESILAMIKDGSYQSQFMNFVTNHQSLNMENKGKGLINGGGVLHKQLLFQKELMQSVIGSLNRLLIPKKYAVKYFPPIPKTSGNGGVVDDVELEFFDMEMRSWKFRYTYWDSSLSFVFTRGWKIFVDRKKLKMKDIVSFYRCENRGESAFYMIDAIVGRSGSESCSGSGRSVKSVLDTKGKRRMEEEVVPPMEEKKRCRLFGVQIN